MLRTYNGNKKAIVYGKDGKTIVFISDNGYRGRRNKESRRVRKRIYGEDLLNVLVYLWYTSDYICGKRLKAYIEESLFNLKKFNEINISKETEEKLIRISFFPSTKLY